MALTKNDLDQIDKRVEKRLSHFEIRLEAALDDKLDEKLTQLKSEFFERIDPILKEVVTAREERPLIENRLENNP